MTERRGETEIRRLRDTGGIGEGLFVGTAGGEPHARESDGEREGDEDDDREAEFVDVGHYELGITAEYIAEHHEYDAPYGRSGQRGDHEYREWHASHARRYRDELSHSRDESPHEREEYGILREKTLGALVGLSRYEEVPTVPEYERASDVATEKVIDRGADRYAREARGEREPRVQDSLGREIPRRYHGDFRRKRDERRLERHHDKDREVVDVADEPSHPGGHESEDVHGCGKR